MPTLLLIFRPSYGPAMPHSAVQCAEYNHWLENLSRSVIMVFVVLCISILKVAQLLIAVVPLFCGCSDSDAATALQICKVNA